MTNGHGNGVAMERYGAEPTALTAGTTATDGFGERSLAKQAEMSTAALQAHATAAIQAKYIMADRRKRDFDAVRQRLLKDCMRVGFAERAIYSKPMGGSKVEGPTVRLAEAALRAMANVCVESPVIYDDPQRRTIRVSVIDLESNTSFDTDVTIEKTVERTSANGRQILSSRKNSQGNTTYTVVATEDELLAKQNSAVSRAIRNNGLRIVPSDIVDEALWQCRETMKGNVAKDPTRARREVGDLFLRQFGVSVEQLAAYLDHPYDETIPDEIEELVQLGNAIADGQTTWRDAFASKLAERSGPAAGGAPASAEGAKERLAAQVEAKKGKASAAQPHDETVLLGELDGLETVEAHHAWRDAKMKGPAWDAMTPAAKSRVSNSYRAHEKRVGEMTS